MGRHVLKTFREAALMLFGAASFSAAFLAVSLYLLRNSDGSFDTGDYQFVLSGGQLFIWHGDDPNPRKLDKPDLFLLACVTSISFLAWLFFIFWRSRRRGGQGRFPVQLLKQTADPIAVEPLGPIATMGAKIGVVTGSPKLRRAMRTVLWLAFATWIILTILNLMRAEEPTVTVAQQKWLLDTEESKYMAAEGHQKRGKDFAAVAGRMDLLSLSKSPFTSSEVQSYLGPPDLYAGPLKQPSAVVYLYARYAKKNCAVIIQFDSQGRTRQFLWTTPPLPGWSTYPTTLPTTLPVKAVP